MPGRPETLYQEVEEIERRVRNLDRKLDLIVDLLRQILVQVTIEPPAKTLVLTLGTPQPQ